MPSKYKENPKRSIYLTQEIDRQLFAKLAPDIIRLRTESSEPIFLYIDSLGGSTFYAERLINLIKTPDQYGKKCELISVGYGFAGSAAADLLALGDYSIVYPRAHIVYHGTRQSKDDITLEDINSLARSLRETNEAYALRLASKMFRRLVFRMIALAIENGPTQGEQFDFSKTVNSPQIFFDQLACKVSPNTKKIFDQALGRQQKIMDLIANLNQKSHPTPNGQMEIDSEAILLKAIIDFEVDRLKAGGVTSLTVDHMHVIQDDYIQLYDFYNGRYRKNLDELVYERGYSFLSKDELAEIEKIKDSSKRGEFLLEKVAPRLNPLWHLVVSMCRILQSADHELPPKDAYWLGLVDEVIGTKLLCMRDLEEEAERAAAEADAKKKD